MACHETDPTLSSLVETKSALASTTSREEKQVESEEKGIPTSSSSQKEQETIAPPPSLNGIRYVLVISGLVLTLFNNNLDRVIVANGMPVIASKFDSLDQAPWIATAYMTTQTTFTMAFGQVLTITSNKWTYLISLSIFMLGNLLSAVAWSFPSLIAGRAVAGTGSGGALISILVLLTSITPLEQRPMVMGLFGIAVAIANVTGPLMGGAFVDHVTWRWCFYIQLPLIALNILIIAICLDDAQVGISRGVHSKHEVALWRRLAQLDWIGNILCFGAVFAFIFSLQGGGVMMPWSDKKIIILFSLAGLCTLLFFIWEHRQGTAKAILPLILFTRRTTIAVAVEAILIMAFVSVGQFFLPLYYQAARDRSAVESGLDILPYLAGTVAGTMSAATIIKRTGRPWPFMFGTPLLVALVSGLVFWAMRTPPKGLTATLIVLQIIYGLGAGASVQQPLIYVQAEHRDEPDLLPKAMVLASFGQMIGGVIGVATAGAILNQRLPLSLKTHAPGLPQDLVLAVLKDVSAIRNLDAVWKELVKKAYAEALAFVFILPIPAGIASAGAALLMTRHNLKQ